ncbi:MAG: DUF3048 domain-containing protein [Clostridiales bacterium]|nr:DUF3048 domain-containing protein [Clostridiales bacterium]
MSDSQELEDILNEIKSKNSEKSDEPSTKIQQPKHIIDESIKMFSQNSDKVKVSDEENSEINKEKITSMNDQIENNDNGSGGKKGKNKKIIIIAVVAVVVIAAIVGVIIAVAGSGSNEDETTTTTTTTTQTTEDTTQAAEVAAVNPLTGESDYNSDAVGKRPIACVVENSYSARLQWGIDDSDNPPDIIVEGEVEGGETRMLWMYADYTSVPSQIGPMRSARPPYIKFSELFDAIFLHWGMSKTKIGTSYIGANTVFREDEVDHIDQMTYTGSVSLFGRDSSRGVSSEHTGVLYGDKIAEAISEQGFRTDADESHYTMFGFNEDDEALSDTTCSSLSLTFSSRTNTRSWTYSEDDKMYHCTDYQTDVARKNLLVLFDTTEYVTKENYKNSGSSEIYCDYKLSGGSGKLASDNSVIDITWSVEDDVLVVKDSQGNEVNLNVGTTWIGYASSNNGGSVTV